MNPLFCFAKTQNAIYDGEATCATAEAAQINLSGITVFSRYVHLSVPLCWLDFADGEARHDEQREHSFDIYNTDASLFTMRLVA